MRALLLTSSLTLLAGLPLSAHAGPAAPPAQDDRGPRAASPQAGGAADPSALPDGVGPGIVRARVLARIAEMQAAQEAQAAEVYEERQEEVGAHNVQVFEELASGEIPIQVVGGTFLSAAPPLAKAAAEASVAPAISFTCQDTGCDEWLARCLTTSPNDWVDMAADLANVAGTVDIRLCTLEVAPAREHRQLNAASATSRIHVQTVTGAGAPGFSRLVCDESVVECDSQGFCAQDYLTPREVYLDQALPGDCHDDPTVSCGVPESWDAVSCLCPSTKVGDEAVDPCPIGENGEIPFRLGWPHVDGLFDLTLDCGGSNVRTASDIMVVTPRTGVFDPQICQGPTAAKPAGDKDGAALSISCDAGQLRPHWSDGDGDGFPDAGSGGQARQGWMGNFCDRTPTILPRDETDRPLAVATQALTPLYVDQDMDPSSYPGAWTLANQGRDHSQGIAQRIPLYGVANPGRVNPLGWQPETGSCVDAGQGDDGQLIQLPLTDLPGTFLVGDRTLSSLSLGEVPVAERAGYAVSCLPDLDGRGFGVAALTSNVIPTEDGAPGSRVQLVFGGPDRRPGVHRLGGPGDEIWLDLDDRPSAPHGTMRIESRESDSLGAQVLAADVNGDGEIDLVLTEPALRRIHLLYGPIDRILAGCTGGLSYADPWCDAVELDADRDERPDLTLRVRRDFIPANLLSGAGAGGDEAPGYARLQVSGILWRVAAGPDGIKIAARAEDGSNEISVIPPARLPSGDVAQVDGIQGRVVLGLPGSYSILATAALDLDGDGDEDLVAGERRVDPETGALLPGCVALWYGPISQSAPEPDALVCSDDSYSTLGGALAPLRGWDQLGGDGLLHTFDALAIGEDQRERQPDGAGGYRYKAGVYLLGGLGDRLSGRYELRPPSGGEPGPRLISQAGGGEADPALLTFIEGPEGSTFGARLASAGDVDGDGRDELLIGHSANQNLADAGGTPIMVTLWRAGGAWAEAGRASWTDADAIFADLDGRDAEPHATVAGGCDLDGDGLDDFLVGLPSFQSPVVSCLDGSASETSVLTGGAWIFHGHGLD